jgi:hypothetical protein
MCASEREQSAGSGRILPRIALRVSIAVLEDGAAQPRTLSLFPEDRCEGLLADASIVRVKPSELRLRRPAPNSSFVAAAIPRIRITALVTNTRPPLPKP